MHPTVDPATFFLDVYARMSSPLLQNPSVCPCGTLTGAAVHSSAPQTLCCGGLTWRIPGPIFFLFLLLLFFFFFFLPARGGARPRAPPLDPPLAGVRDFIAKDPSQVVLVCDGLDEGCADESSLLWRVMVGNSFRGMRVIVTSRPCSTLSSLSQSGAVHRHVQMCGFSEKNVEEFAVKYLGEQRGEEMISQLPVQPSVASLMHTPFFALLICEQFKETDELPRRRSDIFCSATLRVVQRFAKSRGMNSSFRHLKNAPAKLYERVLEVGKVAFDRLNRKDLSYFEVQDEDLSPEAVQLGFLEHVQATSPSRANQLGFRHLTVQEYLAALYASVVELKRVEDVTALVEQLGCDNLAGHLSTFWVFVAGLLESSLREALFCAIAMTNMEKMVPGESAEDGCSTAEQSSEKVSGDAAPASAEISGMPGEDQQGLVGGEDQDDYEPLESDRLLLLLHCCNEVVISGQSKPSACVEHVLKRQGVSLHCGMHTSFLTRADIDVVSRMIVLHGDILEEINMVFHFFAEDSAVLLQSLNACTCLKTLTLSSPPLSLFLAFEDTPENFSVLVQSSKSLEELDLSYTSWHRSGLCKLKDKIRHCRQLKNLRLRKCRYKAGDCQNLAAILRLLPALTEFSLAGNAIGDSDFAMDVAPALQSCEHMADLDLHDIGLKSDSQSMSALASMLVNLPELAALDLGSNAVLRDASFAAIVAPALQNCRRIKRLGLNRVGLRSKSESMSAMARTLLSLPELTDLDLGCNMICDDGLLQLAPALQQCSQLQSLKLSFCLLSGNEANIALLVSILLCLPQLKELAVGSNRISDGGLDQLLIGLEACPQLRTLDLGPTNGEGSTDSTPSLTATSRLIKRLDHLETLTLPGDTSASRSNAIQLCRAVKSSSSLRELYLPRGMSPDIVRQLQSLLADVECPLQGLFQTRSMLDFGIHSGETIVCDLKLWHWCGPWHCDRSVAYFVVATSTFYHKLTAVPSRLARQATQLSLLHRWTSCTHSVNTW